MTQEWHPWNGTLLKPVWTELIGAELYAHANDTGINTDAYENTNLVGDSTHADLVKQLSQQLRTAFEHM